MMLKIAGVLHTCQQQGALKENMPRASKRLGPALSLRIGFKILLKVYSFTTKGFLSSWYPALAVCNCDVPATRQPPPGLGADDSRRWRTTAKQPPPRRCPAAKAKAETSESRVWSPPVPPSQSVSLLLPLLQGGAYLLWNACVKVNTAYQTHYHRSTFDAEENTFSCVFLVSLNTESEQRCVVTVCREENRDMETESEGLCFTLPGGACPQPPELQVSAAAHVELRVPDCQHKMKHCSCK